MNVIKEIDEYFTLDKREPLRQAATKIQTAYQRGLESTNIYFANFPTFPIRAFKKVFRQKGFTVESTKELGKDRSDVWTEGYHISISWGNVEICPENIIITIVECDSHNIGHIISTGRHYIGYYIYPSNRSVNAGLGISYCSTSKKAVETWVQNKYYEDKECWDET